MQWRNPTNKALGRRFAITGIGAGVLAISLEFYIPFAIPAIVVLGSAAAYFGLLGKREDPAHRLWVAAVATGIGSLGLLPLAWLVWR